MKPNYLYKATVTRIVDGDTIDVNLDLGCHVSIHRRLRLLNIDTWEVRGEEREKGLIAKQFVIDKLAEAKEIVIETFMDAEGKYGRLLAIVWFDGVNLNDLLIVEGHATVYVY